MSKTQISVIIPAYNEEKYLQECLDSLEKQKTSLNYEIIVVNNNSKDRTEEIARKNGIKVVNEKTQGVGWARRTGTGHAKGEIVVHIDADTRVYPDYLEKIWKHFKEDKNLVCLGGQFLFYDAPHWKNILRSFLYRIVLSFVKIASKGVLGPMGNNMAFKRDSYEKTKGFNPYLKFGEDVEITLQLKNFGKTKVDLNLKVKTSARRYEKILSKSFLLYCLNFISFCVRGKPYKNVLPEAKK